MHKADRTQSRVLFIGCAYSCMSEIIFTQPIEVETNCPLLFRTTISNTFSWMKMYEFRWRFHWICLWGSNNKNIPALARIMAWCQPGDRPLSGPMMVNLLTHICATQPQWVKTGFESVYACAPALISSRVRAYAFTLQANALTCEWLVTYLLEFYTAPFKPVFIVISILYCSFILFDHKLSAVYND